MVEQIACGLHQAGLARGEHMVVIGANRPRLYATMLAAQSLGAIPVPEGWSEVADIVLAGGELILADVGGGRVAVPFDADFLDGC